MKLIFLGPPGAGKGTQALGVSSKLAVPHISTGDMLRAAVRNQTATGLAAKAYMDKGQLVPDEVLIDMVRERLSMDDCAAGYLLDGFPRTVEQAEALEQISAPDMVVNISVPDVKLLERLAGRRVCGKCQGTFHISKLADEEVCPVCKGELIHREDDKPETVKHRLEVYHAETEPLKDFYAARGILKPVDNQPTIEATSKAVMEALGL